MIGFLSVTLPIFTDMSTIASVPISKFVSICSAPRYELRNQRDARNFTILGWLEFEVPLRVCRAHEGTSNSPPQRLLQIEYRSVDADAAQLLLAVDLERAHADVTGAESAGHHLLHGDLARNAVLLAEPLHQLHQPVRAAGVERIGTLLGDQPLENRLDVLDRARAVGIEHRDHVADLGEEISAERELATARAQDGGDLDAVLARELRDRAHGGKPDAAAEHH